LVIPIATEISKPIGLCKINEVNSAHAYHIIVNVIKFIFKLTDFKIIIHPIDAAREWRLLPVPAKSDSTKTLSFISVDTVAIHLNSLNELILPRALLFCRMTYDNERKFLYFCRPTYDSNLPLSGYVISSAGRLSSSIATIQKEVERLGGKFSSKIDETVGIVISSQGISHLYFSSSI